MTSFFVRNRYKTPQTDRRAHLRIGFDCPCRWNDGGVDRRGFSRDISPNDAGFTVRAISAPEVGQDIRLIFELEPEREWLASERATVKRCDLRTDGLCDVGVELNLPDDD